MPALGSPLPSFALPDVVSNQMVSAKTNPARKGTLVMFVCNHCPYVVHVRDELVRVAHDALERGLDVFAINANSEKSHPQDGPEAMRAWATSAKFRFPFLFDATQGTARAFNAACTPEFHVFDAKDALVYCGQLDDSRPSNGKPVNGRDLRAAIDALLANREPIADQTPAVGCGIKWHG